MVGDPTPPLLYPRTEALYPFSIFHRQAGAALYPNGFVT